jgi:hypothetical protein
VTTRGAAASASAIVDGREYYVVTDGDGWITLTESEINALRVAAGEDWWAVDLFEGMGTANNQKSFTAAEVNPADDTITLNRDDPVFNLRAGAGGGIRGGRRCSSRMTREHLLRRRQYHRAEHQGDSRLPANRSSGWPSWRTRPARSLHRSRTATGSNLRSSPACTRFRLRDWLSVVATPSIDQVLGQGRPQERRCYAVKWEKFKDFVGI